jgi:hypothetical protein
MIDKKILNFARKDSSGIYYKDLEVKLFDAVIYDVYKGTEQVGTLVTNNRKGIALTNNAKLILESKWSWIGRNKFLMRDEEKKNIATISTKQSGFFFSGLIYSLRFDNENQIYEVNELKSRELNNLNAYSGYNFLLGERLKCQVLNLRKPPFLYSPTANELQGTISYCEEITLVHILCFLQFIQIHLELENSSL